MKKKPLITCVTPIASIKEMRPGLQGAAAWTDHTQPVEGVGFATAQLMAEFYRSMEKDGMAPAAALRQAQITMWKQKRWSSPYFWAAFQLQGEWK